MLVLALVAICAVLTLVEPNFLSSANLINVVRQVSISGILTMGVTFVLLTGGVDLSLGSVVALAGVSAGLAAQSTGPMPVTLGFGAAVVVGALCGAANGWVITKARVAPFIVTLGMLTAARGLALVASGGRPVSNLAPDFIAVARTTVLGIPVLVLIFAAVAGSVYIFLRYFRWGRYIYAIGGNEHAARASGLNVAGGKLLAYVLCGSAAGLAGALLAARTTTGQPNAGVGYELDAIAAAVIGGISLSGGVGRVSGAVLGVLLIGVISNGLDLLGVPSYYQLIVKGVIVVTAVCLDRQKSG